MDSFLQDIRFGFRTLLKARIFAAACVLTLALGIGCATTMFSLFEGPILNRPPVSNLNQIANVWVINQKNGVDRGLVSVPNFLDLKSRATAFQELAALAASNDVLTDMGQPQRVSTLMVSPNFFHLLGARPKLGRTFSQDEEQLGASRVAIISEGMWRTVFGGSPDVLGQTIHLNSVPYKLIGVMPRSFWFQDQGTQVWTPLTLDASANRADGTLVVVGRMRKGITSQEANAQVAVLARALQLQFPTANGGMGMRVVAYESEMNKKAGLGLVFGLGPAILVLLIGCANITNLLLARGFARQREFATRAALGATRGRLVRQLLSEYSPIAVVGAAAGVLAAYGGVAEMRRAFQSVQPNLAATLSLNGTALAFGIIAGLLVPLLFGFIPAMRVSKASLGDALRQNSAVVGAQVSLKRLPLVALEVAMAMALLIVTASATRTMSFIERVAPPRVDSSKVISFHISPMPEGSKLNQLADYLKIVPTVDAVGMTSGFPTVDPRSDFHTVSVKSNGKHLELSAVELKVNSGFFSVLRLSALQGQLNSTPELEDAVVSESFARRYRGNALGLQVRGMGGAWLPVTAVVSDWLTDARSGHSVPTVYLPLSSQDAVSQIAVRAEDGAAAIPAIKRSVWRWNINEPMDDCNTVAKSTEEQFAGSNLVVQLMTSFTILALMLGCIGVYGVMNYSVTRRTHEIGIRMALGSTPNRVLRLVLKEAAMLSAVGLSVGWLFGVGAGRLIAHELVIPPSDPLTGIACSAMIMITGLTATYIPARRAARVNPMVALRFE